MKKTTHNKSYFINTYNSLDGKKVTRKNLKDFYNELYFNLPLNPGSHLEYILRKINNLLKSNPKIEEFEISIKNKLSVAGLNGIKKIKNKVIGYAIVDNITGDIIASKKELLELKKVFKTNLEHKKEFRDMPVLVYSIIKKGNKNVVNKKIKVNWKKPIKTSSKKSNKNIKSKKIIKPSGKLIKGVKPLSKIEKRVYPTHTRIKNNPLYKFLGNLEIKNTGSIIITTDADQGAGKTRNLFQKANMYAESGYKVLFISLEEQPDSRLFNDKVKEYFSKKALENIYPIGEINKNKFDEIVPLFDFILIDSWNKLQKQIYKKDNYKLNIDDDIRLKFHGKIFDMIFQRTASGKMRGGSEAQFDGDVIIKIKRMPNWKDNYAYYDKNRYMLDNYVWNIYEQKLYLFDDYMYRFQKKENSKKLDD